MRVRAFFLVRDADNIERVSVRHFDLATGDEIPGHVPIPPHGNAEHTTWPDALWAVRFHP